jgi:hypothetical protein
MSEEIRKRARDLVEKRRAMPESVRDQLNRRAFENAKANHEQFRTAYLAGRCFNCGQKLNSFDPQHPCVHWLLKPPGFTKRHFLDVARRFSLFQIQMFLRWVANEEAFAKNINDLSDEGTGKLVEVTIRYKDIEWSFSCSETDFFGHTAASPEAQRPHYHFQMRHKGQAFIRFNDFHVALLPQDIHLIEAGRAAAGGYKVRFAGGEGMQDVLNEDILEDLVMRGCQATSADEEMLHLQTMIVAKDGETISGETVYNMFKEAQAKNVTVASLAKNLSNASALTIVDRGPAVVDQAPRSGRGSKKSD